MATRYHLSTVTHALTPAFDAGWEQTGQAIRRKLVLAKSESTIASETPVITVPITTTQDILFGQYISDPIWNPQALQGTISVATGFTESASTANVTLAVVAKVISNDGSTVRATIFSTFNTDTEFSTSAATAVRIVNAQAITATTIQSGDRILIEIGGHAAAPTAATTYQGTSGNLISGDEALTSASTTINLGMWVEFSNDIQMTVLNNYQFVKVGDGMSTSEKIR